MQRLLLIGGLDPSGGAGVTLDAAVASLHGLQPLPVAALLTVQSQRGFVEAKAVDEGFLRAQIDAVLADGPVHAVKLGLLVEPELAAFVADVVEALPAHVPLVVDPVLSATTGGLAPAAELLQIYRERLGPRAALLTPNLPELALLWQGDPQRALDDGAGAVLVKGGHGEGMQSEDVLWNRSGQHRSRRPRLDIGLVRGTGCALATAVAARLVRGADLEQACVQAGEWLWQVLSALGPDVATAVRTLPIGAVRP